MAKQTFTTGQVLTAAQLTSLQQTAMGGGAASAKTASYTLVAADAGTTISMTSTSATTITVNTGLFAAGDTVFIQNLGSGNLTITAGSATVATAGSLILPQNDAGILYFVSTSSSVFYDFIQVGATSPLTTKGDLYGFSTSDARIPIGANNTVLTADSTESLGLKWATPASGGGMTLLSTTSLTGSTVTVSSISQSYKDLRIIIRDVYVSTSDDEFFRLNSDTGNNYSYREMSTVVTSGSGGSGTLSCSAYEDFSKMPVMGSKNDSAVNRRAYAVIDIFRYTESEPKMTVSTAYFSAGSTPNRSQRLVNGIYNSNTAISSFTYFPDTGTFSAGTIYIYGVS